MQWNVLENEKQSANQSQAKFIFILNAFLKKNAKAKRN